LQSIFAPVAANLSVGAVLIGFHDLYNEGQYLTVFGMESLSRLLNVCIKIWIRDVFY